MIHGGDIYTAAELIGKNSEDIIDMSSSVNPLPLPFKIKKKLIKNFNLLNRYPDTDARSFKKIICDIYGISSESIICGNGSIELIYIALKALNPQNVLILEPTFLEYERACRINNVPNIDRIFSLDRDEVIKIAEKKLKNTKYSLVFICNPNNPTGWLIKKETILNLADTVKDTIFLIDEAFIDFTPEETVIHEVGKIKNLLVLRSLTKFYGLAGLRFGYAAGCNEIIEQLKKFIQPWSINSIAQCAAEEIIKDENFKNMSYEFFIKEKQFFENSLKKLTLNYFPSAANFYFIKLPKKGFPEEILNKGILIRDCSNFYRVDENFIRVSIKTRKQNELFFRELKKWLKAL